jgi:hypothetical protein
MDKVRGIGRHFMVAEPLSVALYHRDHTARGFLLRACFRRNQAVQTLPVKLMMNGIHMIQLGPHRSCWKDCGRK